MGEGANYQDVPATIASTSVANIVLPAPRVREGEAMGRGGVECCVCE